ncbi:MAG: signal peptidase I [Anaerolineaceae bacterium]|nr:signal peptidase I [Anaerolineaceae bacterium]
MLDPERNQDIRSEENSAPLLDEQRAGTVSAWKKFRHFLWELLQMIVITLVLYFGIDAMIGRVQVESISMMDTIKPNVLLMVSKFAYRNDKYSRGDVIVFHYPNNPTDDYIKRVIGLAGDVVEVQNGSVYVNGININEPYIKESPMYTGTWVVPEDTLFVLGDNRNHSSDSHEWGFVPFENVFGRAFLIYWPLDEFEILNRMDIVSAYE